MPGGKVKKKKPAANPARGVATTSIASKAKPLEKPDEISSIAVSGVNTPDQIVPPVVGNKAVVTNVNGDRELHELSPEELEARLELSELQAFVENHGSKVRKESSRQVTRLQTEKRLLRGQADHLSVKDWLPEELILHILDLVSAPTGQATSAIQGRPLPKGDELLSKVWQLRTTLLGLDLQASRVSEAVAHVLSQSTVSSTDQAWGVTECLEWLAWNCNDEELHEYEYVTPKSIVAAPEPEEVTPRPTNGHAQGPIHQCLTADRGDDDDGGDDVAVSDIESDLEPDELISVYLRTKTRLFEINPESQLPATARRRPQSRQLNGGAKNRPSRAEVKLQQRLQKIERDLLFDSYIGESQWLEKQSELMREYLERRKWQLDQDQQATNGHANYQSPSQKSTSPPDGVNDAAERLGQAMLDENADASDDDLLGGMFSALNGDGVTAASASRAQDVVASENVTIRDLGKIAGMSPKRVLEEACKARDSRAKLVYKLISPTTFTSRHSVMITWSKDAEPVESILDALTVDTRGLRTTISMMKEATPDTAQSEAYVATAALFLVFSGSSKEEKAHLRLPPALRDLWDEFAQQKRDVADLVDRETVKEVRDLIEANVRSPVDDEDYDEIVFNPAIRRLNGASSGTSTPPSRQELQTNATDDQSASLKAMWAGKNSTTAYQRMLLARKTLPMFQFRADALDTIHKNPITILCGETGCGKSTQLPAFILEHELSQGRHCKIYCTEPRRISAISLAQRVSEEMGERKGDVGTSRSLVGYAIRLEAQTTASTRLVYATVGIVLRMLESAKGLDEITHLVLDEVHERSIDTDFLLIVLRSLMLKRPDLKVVLMSATVDAQKFSRYLDNAPIIIVPGRTFPVQAMYLEDAIELTGHTKEDASARAPGGDDNDDADGDAKSKSDDVAKLTTYSKRTRTTLANYDEYRIDYSLIVKIIEKVSFSDEYKSFSQAVLVFMPGIAEIRQLNDMLQGHPSFRQGWRIQPLHSTFSSEDQQAAFEVPTNGERKIVIATNIAETGITIPDVTCVIDTGKHKEMRFDEKRQMSRLIQSFIARANAKQRRGRAGRVQEGICFHLFTKHRHDEMMAEAQVPEMLRLSLQDLVMRVKICKLGDIELALSQALDPPSSKNIRRAIDALIEVDALTSREELTPLGQQLAKLPLDAQLGKLVLLGSIYGGLDFALTIAATLSSKSPFLSPMNAKKQADTVRLGFKRGDSDLLTVYNAYQTWRRICTTPGQSEYTFCNKNFLSPQNLANIEDLKAQLLSSLSETGFVSLSPEDRQALARMRHNTRQRSFVTLPLLYTRAEPNDDLLNAITAWSFYPKLAKRDGKGWRNVANAQSLGLHPTSINKSLPSNSPIQYLSYYSIMQSASRFTNAQEMSPVSDFALVLMAGDAVFNMYAGVIVVDGNRLRFKVRDWRSMYVIKVLRGKCREVLARLLKNPGRDVGVGMRAWMEVFERVFAREGRVRVAGA
ncbi:hypothetical protein B0A48_17857 [Cryoendolithus antarcticus]|uniref:RNA helicase n=1 Tax=Cryoendolithus antarcticus TaxID=1507870 RepID=A0A1V8SAN4_9PEZI|nr:hypothetical protein B0A48_17857 [Cryoendolithus antarcticus]